MHRGCIGTARQPERRRGERLAVAHLSEIVVGRTSTEQSAETRMNTGYSARSADELPPKLPRSDACYPSFLRPAIRPKTPGRYRRSPSRRTIPRMDHDAINERCASELLALLEALHTSGSIAGPAALWDASGTSAGAKRIGAASRGPSLRTDRPGRNISESVEDAP